MARLVSIAAFAIAIFAASSGTQQGQIGGAHSAVRFADAFTKDYPKGAPHGAEWRDRAEAALKEREAAADGSNKGTKSNKKTNEIGTDDDDHPDDVFDREYRQPGTLNAAEIDAAMPDYNDPIDGPQLECTACLSVSDIVARRFSRLKTEFRVNMENIKPFHVDAALDELCSREQRFVGLLLPNVTNDLGKRVESTWRRERQEKEDELLAEAKKKKAAEKKPKKKSGKKKAANKKDDGKKKNNKKADTRTAEQKNFDAEEKEWRVAGLDDYAIARRTKMRLPYSIWPEYADEREIRKKLNGGIPQDVSVLRTIKIQTEWQRFCGEAMGRMEDFGLLKVFRGSKTFNLCPMCRSEDPLAQGRTHNPGGVSPNAEEANAVSDAELKKRRREQKKKELAAKLKSKRIDAGDDEEDERFIHGQSDDEYEL